MPPLAEIIAPPVQMRPDAPGSAEMRTSDSEMRTSDSEMRHSDGGERPKANVSSARRDRCT